MRTQIVFNLVGTIVIGLMIVVFATDNTELRRKNRSLDFENALLRSAIACSTYDCQAQVATCESRIWQVAHEGKAGKP